MRGRRTIAGMSWREWVRNAEVEPSLYAADFARLGEQIDVLLRAGCRIFHFDVGDGHFVEPITIGPVVLESIAPLVHDAGGVLDCHLMVDNPLRHFPQIARARRRQRHLPLRGRRRRPRHDRRRARARPAGRRRLQPRERARGRRRRRGGRRPRALHEHPSRLQRPEVHAGGGRRGSRACARRCPSTSTSRSTAGSTTRRIGAAHGAGAALLVAGSAIFGREDPAAAYRGLVQDLA